MADAQIVSSLWWRARAASVREYLSANPLNLGIPSDGTLETIQHLLLRGDAHPKAQRKCWKHLALEMEGLPGWDHDRAMPDRTFFKASALSRMKEPPPIPPTPVPPPSEVREEEHNAEGFPGERRHDAEAASPIHTTGDVAASSPPPVPVLDMVSVAELSGASLSRSSRSSSAPSKDVLPAASLSARASIHCGADDGPSSEAAADAALQDSKFVSPSNKTSAKPLSQMSMMERQEYWMNKKKLFKSIY